MIEMKSHNFTFLLP